MQEIIRLHFHHNFQNIPEFIELCLQIAVDNMPLMVKTCDAKLNVIEVANTLKSVKPMIKQHEALKVVTVLFLHISCKTSVSIGIFVYFRPKYYSVN